MSPENKRRFLGFAENAAFFLSGAVLLASAFTEAALYERSPGEAPSSFRVGSASENTMHAMPAARSSRLERTDAED